MRTNFAAASNAPCSADVVKLSVEELAFFTGETQVETGLDS
jgi:hypothetical protein